MIDLLRFKSELEDYKKEKGEMRRVKALLVGVEEEHTAIVWEHETLSQRFAGDSAVILSSLSLSDIQLNPPLLPSTCGSIRLTELKTERDELRRNFHASVFDVKQKSTFRSLLFEKKLSAMQRIQEEREAQLVEVLSTLLSKFL